MKIGFGAVPQSVTGTYTGRLAELLARHAPQHEYRTGCCRQDELDIFHDLSLYPTAAALRSKAPCVVTVRDLGFLQGCGSGAVIERFVRQPRYRRCCRRAGRIVTTSEKLRAELARQLHLDLCRIASVLPLSALPPAAPPNDAECEAVRRKYMLPEEYMLVFGGSERRCRIGTLLQVMAACNAPQALVVCCRHTLHADELLALVRRLRLAGRVEFLYEWNGCETAALLHMASGLIYLPAGDAPIVPVVEAMRAGIPMLLSDTPLNREAAEAAARYVDPDDSVALACALADLLSAPARTRLIEAGYHIADRFSERAVADRMLEIYAELL